MPKKQSGNRIIALDILKGVLIITVVIGHVYAPLRWLDVFWFHMPAFFMISGYATKDWHFDTESLKKKIVRLWIPYATYCILLLPFIPNVSYGRQLLKFVIGGGNSTTCLTYPFWFANSMLIACVAYSCLKTYVSSIVRISFIFLVWIVIHIVHVPDYLPVYLPLGSDLALGALCYIEIGALMKKYANRYCCLLGLIPFGFAMCNGQGCISFRLNMMSMIYNNICLDLLIPLSFTILLYGLCLYIEKCTIISVVFQYIGTASMSIMFMHIAIIYLSVSFGLPKLLCVMLGILIPIVANYLYNLKPLTRLLFLGSYSDCKKT